MNVVHNHTRCYLTSRIARCDDEWSGIAEKSITDFDSSSSKKIVDFAETIALAAYADRDEVLESLLRLVRSLNRKN